MNKSHIQSIQGVRGIFAFIIAYIFHYELLFQSMPVHTPVLEWIFQQIGRLTFYASDVFFLISGYFTCKSYEKRIESGEAAFVPYFSSKIKKLYPYLMITVCINFILERVGLILLGNYPLHGSDGNGVLRYSVRALLMNLLGVQSGWFSEGDSYAVNGPSWFLSVLFLCYLIHFILIRMVGNERTRKIVYVLFVTVGIILMLHPLSLPFLYQVNGRGYTSYFLGVLMYVCLEKVPEKWKKRIVIPVAWVMGVTLFVCATTTIDFMLLMVCVIYPAIVYLAIYDKISQTILGHPILQWLGKLSLPIYLCNVPIDTGIALANQQFRLSLDFENKWVWLGHILISIMLSWLCCKFVKIKKSNNLT